MLSTDYIFLSRGQRRLIQHGMGIYVFHKVSLPLPDTRDPFEYTAPAEFERKLVALGAAGFQSASLGDTRSDGTKRFTVTFDDGYAGVAEHALPVLQRQHIRAIEFLVAGKLGGRNDWDIAKGDVPEPLMSVAQVKEWLAAGQQIGSHGLTHANLRKLSPKEAREEITASKKLLEDAFGLPVEHFCYPFGAYNEQIRNWVAEAGYQTACTVKFGVHLPGSPPFELNRIAPLTAVELLRKALHRLRRKLLAPE